jgi:sodium-dependent dicarboxylate transporter 2/3/5
VPTALVLLSSTYFLLTRLLFPNRIHRVESSAQYLSSKLKSLGPLTREEKIVMLVFAATSLCWIFQQPLNDRVFQRDVLNDTVIGLAGGLLMFIIPVNFKKMEFILNWTDTTKINWGILILFGGGLCLAEGLHQAALIERVGQAIASQSQFGIIFILGLLVITVILSELMSNVALVQVFVPVVFGIANSFQQDPLLMTMPIALAASIGFMFPIATPPNAIVFSSGYIRIKDMMKAGLLLDVVSIILLWIFSITLVPWVFGE